MVLEEGDWRGVKQRNILVCSTFLYLVIKFPDKCLLLSRKIANIARCLRLWQLLIKKAFVLTL